jgi:hypothetical protein
MIQHLNAKGAFEDNLLKAERMDLYPYDEIMENVELEELLIDWFYECVSVSDLFHEDRPVYEVFYEDYRNNWDEWPTEAYDLAADILATLIKDNSEEEEEA